MREGGFSRVLSEVGGEVIGDLAAHILIPTRQYGASPETLVVHAENPQSDGVHGYAQCLAIVTPQTQREGMVMIESPEILSLDLLQKGASQQFGISGSDIARVTYPISIQEKGNYTYDRGHLTPTRLNTSEGSVLLESAVLSNRGFVRTKFTPSWKSRFPGLEFEVEVI
jgi:hypothetical protein